MYIDPQEQVGLNEMQFPMKFWHVMVTKLQKTKKILITFIAAVKKNKTSTNTGMWLVHLYGGWASAEVWHHHISFRLWVYILFVMNASG